MPTVARATPPLLTDPDPTALFGVPGSDHAQFGMAKLVAGTVTVVNKKITANSMLFYCGQDNAVTGALTVVKTAGTGFVITSAVGADTGNVAWMLINA